MNLYATISDFEAVIGSPTSARARVLQDLEDASRTIDAHCRRHFYIETGTRYFDAVCGGTVWIDDFLSLSALTVDSEEDGTHDGETWVQGTDWTPLPYNGPCRRGIRTLNYGTYAMPDAERYIKAVGEWGYTEDAVPYLTANCTGTVATESGTALTISVTAGLVAGQTILIDSERMYVESVTTTTATVRRAVNGSTAATHSAAAIYVYRYPRRIERATVAIAVAAYNSTRYAGMRSETIGAYSYSAGELENLGLRIDRLVGPYRRRLA